MRIGSMLFLAAFVMLLLYPALHGLGHAAAAQCFGAELKGIELFPVPCTTMVFFGASGTKLLVTAFCGSLFPLLLLALPDLGRFSLYDIKLTAALITAADSLTSLISVTFIRPGAGWLFCYPIGWGLIGAWTGLAFDQLCRFIMTYIRFKSGRWTRYDV